MTSPGQRHRIAPSRIRAATALVLIALLAVPLLPDARDALRRDWRYARPFRANGSFVKVLSSLRYKRLVSLYIGLAARDVAGGLPEEVVGPVAFASFAEREGDRFQDVERPALNPSLVKQVIGGNLTLREYDARLTDDQLNAIIDAAGGDVREFPSGVFSVGGATADGSPQARVVLHTDSSRDGIYVIPAALSPLSGSEPR